MAALSSEGYRVRQALPGATVRQAGSDRFEVDFADPQAMEKFHELLRGSDNATVGCVINFLGLMAPFNRPGGDADNALTISQWTFNLAKQFEDDLAESAVAGGGIFINLTPLGGQFALGDVGDVPLAAAGTLGIAKTLRREAPQLMVKSIDVDPALAPEVLATRLLEELAVDDDQLEIGLTSAGRWKIDLRPAPPVEITNLPLDGDSVVLITGGAFGVTADTAIGIARASRCKLVLVGRSALPGEEAPDTRDLPATGLRAKFIELARQGGQRLVPAEIERAVNRVLKDRQIRANIAACQAAGSTIEYHSLDVRDGEQLGALIDDVYARYGRLDGVVHGAGVIEDKRIRDKSLESFATVWRTKVDSALTLANKLRPDSLKFLVFFSSVSGRFGNTGQVDYSAANEFLNKLADRLDRRWPARVVAINWGPWDGGMVTDELRRMYATVGFDLIPIDEGVRIFLAEIQPQAAPSAEVIVSGSVEQMIASSVKSGA